ncbi:MAG: aldehyde dehydrogenase (NADP(+)) [Bacteroidota bacterium]
MDGRNLIGYRYSALVDDLMQAFDPATKSLLEGQFHMAGEAEIQQAMELAAQAAAPYARLSGKDRAAFLRAIAEEIEQLGDLLIQRAMQESGLPEGRLKGERGRTVGQLRLFAQVAEEGQWRECRIDKADPDRKPFPKADIRRILCPLGPVVVFTASNFPLAFSTAGGDTASALAAGCPVVVKAHESHLGTNALVAAAIRRAAQRCQLPEGVFSSLNGSGPELGQALVKHPLTQAVAFTGSYGAGKAIFDSAAQRPTPIPVFAEMGSINPVVLLDSVLTEKAEETAQQLAGSITLGAGQFCTNPGLLIACESPELDRFVTLLGQAIEQSSPATMLNEKVCRGYGEKLQQLLDHETVTVAGASSSSEAGEALTGQPVIASVSGRDFLQNDWMQHEVFGPSSLLVRCKDVAERLEVVKSLAGQLTGTFLGTAEELQAEPALVAALQDRVGRLIFNGVPTGVEVCAAMQHGGPFPATTDSRFTSVGTEAIKRFARPVSYQNWPQALLPEELRD